jgi:hypothetical protein
VAFRAGALVVMVAVGSGAVLHLTGAPRGAAASSRAAGGAVTAPGAGAAPPGGASSASARPGKSSSDGVDRTVGAEKSAMAAPAPSTDLGDLATSAVRKAVKPIAAKAAGQVSVAVADLTTGVSAGYGAAGHSFVTASIVKADILAALLLQTQQAGHHLTTQEKTWAGTMIRNSDNAAADALYNRIGQAAGLNRANRTFGLTATKGGSGGRWGLTTTNAQDQLALLRTVFGDDSVLSSASRTYLRTLMGQVEADQDWGVSAAGDPKAESMLKNGWLPRTATGLWVINSIGMVQNDGHRMLVAVLSDGNRTQAGGISLIESVAAAAADALTAVLQAQA